MSENDRLNFARPFTGLIGIERDYSLESFARAKFADPKDYENSDIDIAVKNFLLNRFRNLYLHSQKPGTGKTGLAIATGRDLQIMQALTARMIRMPELSIADFERRSAILDSIQDRGAVYILDDIHRFKTSTSFGADFLWALINRLMLINARIIVTSNLSLAGLTKKVGEDSEASLDRLYQGGLYELELTGDSLRR